MYKKAITHPTKDNSSIKDEINLVSRLENKTVGSHEVGKRNRFGPKINIFGAYFSSVQSLSRVQLFATPWTTARQASLSVTNSWSLLKLMSIESVMPPNHLILCHPLLLPSFFPSIRVFSNESLLCHEQYEKILFKRFQKERVSFCFFTVSQFQGALKDLVEPEAVSVLL